MTNDEGDSIGDSATAQCGACQAVIPSNSDKCPECNISFSGLQDVDMGECGACQAIIPIDSISCPECNISFVLDDLINSVNNWMTGDGLTVTDVFGKWDENSDGVLSASEIRNGLLEANIAVLPTDEIDRFMHQLDLNHDDEITFPELSAALLLPKAQKVEDDATEEDAEVDDVEDILLKESDDESDGDASDEDDDESEEEESDDETEESEEDESDDEDDTEDSDDDDSDDDEDTEDSDDDSDDELSPATIFTRLVDSISESGETARSIFEKLDRNDSENVDPDEFKKAVSEAFDEDFSDEDLDAIIKVLDTDDDGFIDIIELTTALEEPDEVVDKLKGKTSDELADWQRFLMRHYENIFPIAYVLFAIFIGVWVVNGAVGPVDGSEGAVAFDGDSTIYVNGSDRVDPGQIYQCDKDFQISKCRNSLTPFSGHDGSSSMPKGFYWDGIMFMILGIIGVIGTVILQMQTKGWRTVHRKKKQSEDEDESDDDDSDDDEGDSDDDEGDSDDDEGDSDDDDEGDSDDDEGDSDDDDEGDSEDDEEIDIGSHVGIEHDGDEWYGVIVKFDDDDDEVLVKSDDDDEEYWVPFDALFMD
jgi:Ca2+-binding EF-hand superfamily protein